MERWNRMVESEEKQAEPKIVDAEQLAKEFKEHSVAEFFKKNKQMLGLYGKVRTLTTVVHEYVTNSVTYDTPVVIRIDGETRIKKIGSSIDELMKENGFECNPKQEVESLRDFEKFEVLCFDKKTNQLKFKEVKSLHRHKMCSTEKIYKIKTVGNRTVEATKHHGLFILNNGKVTEARAETLSVGNYLVVPRRPWLEETKREINILEEALKLEDIDLKEFSIFGVKKILYSSPHLKDKINLVLMEKDNNCSVFMTLNTIKHNMLSLSTDKIVNS